ncbi:hypothetical protein KFE25_002234 [Diacronema lutheri]|uniref:Uncharacterized protein n=1 Tax=Diacronema lutheri TaxID=2081491 RepID=A0A8J6CG94_DIALT|nr:hypothetical protein KFE25_002234 [Diacronema lutheri]
MGVAVFESGRQTMRGAIDGFEEEMVARLQRQLDAERSTSATLRHQLRLAHAQALEQRAELLRLRADDSNGRTAAESERRDAQAEARLEKARRGESEALNLNRELAARIATLERVSRDGDARHAAVSRALELRTAELSAAHAKLRDAHAALDSARGAHERAAMLAADERAQLLAELAAFRARAEAARLVALRQYARAGSRVAGAPRPASALGLGALEPCDEVGARGATFITDADVDDAAAEYARARGSPPPTPLGGSSGGGGGGGGARAADGGGLDPTELASRRGDPTGESRAGRAPAGGGASERAAGGGDTAQPSERGGGPARARSGALAATPKAGGTHARQRPSSARPATARACRAASAATAAAAAVAAEVAGRAPPLAARARARAAPAGAEAGADDDEGRGAPRATARAAAASAVAPLGETPEELLRRLARAEARAVADAASGEALRAQGRRVASALAAALEAAAAEEARVDGSASPRAERDAPERARGDARACGDGDTRGDADAGARAAAARALDAGAAADHEEIRAAFARRGAERPRADRGGGGGDGDDGGRRSRRSHDGTRGSDDHSGLGEDGAVALLAGDCELSSGQSTARASHGATPRAHGAAPARARDGAACARSTVTPLPAGACKPQLALGGAGAASAGRASFGGLPPPTRGACATRAGCAGGLRAARPGSASGGRAARGASAPGVSLSARVVVPACDEYDERATVAAARLERRAPCHAGRAVHAATLPNCAPGPPVRIGSPPSAECAGADGGECAPRLASPALLVQRALADFGLAL